MKYKVGDKVKVRTWSDMALEFSVDEDGDIKVPHHQIYQLTQIYFTKKMEQYCGKTVTIKDRHESEGYYDIIEDTEDEFCFSDDMFE